MAAVVAIGGDGLARVAAARALGGEREEPEGGEMQGVSWRSEGDPGRRGNTQAGWRWPACGCARRARALQSFWRELEEDKGERWAGPTVLGQHSAGQVSGSGTLLSLSLLYVFYLFDLF